MLLNIIHKIMLKSNTPYPCLNGNIPVKNPPQNAGDNLATLTPEQTKRKCPVDSFLSEVNETC